MTTESTTDRECITGRHCYFLLAASVMTYLLITMGGIVCVSGSGQGCPDWPGCYGQIVPPMRADAIIEYMHRFIAALTSPLVIAGAVISWRRSRSIWWVSRPAMLAVVFLLAVVVFGALAVLRGLAPGVAAVDLGSALMVLALVLTASVMAFSRRANPALPDRLSFRGPFAKLTLGTLIGMFIVLVSGVLVAESGSIVRCLGWPLYSGRLAAVDLRSGLQIARQLIAGVVSVSIITVVVQAWRTQRGQTAILRVATAVGILFLAEMTVGVFMLTRGSTLFLLATYAAMTVAMWSLSAVLTVLAGLAFPVPTQGRIRVTQLTQSAA
jgi:cytochrome c oxidase assembly protein subunit 15